MKTNTKSEIPQHTAQNYLKLIFLEFKCQIIRKRKPTERTKSIQYVTTQYLILKNKIDIFPFEMLFNLSACHVPAAKKCSLTKDIGFRAKDTGV
jgi:hypothetical protein